MTARLPTVVVVGSPNAGKSTLVNRLSGSRQAVVHETPGVTRDRKEIEAEWNGRRFTLVDTGGFDTTRNAPFAADVREQIKAAVAGADVVVFVVDGRAGPVADDFTIANVLRRQPAPVALVANKIDDLGRREPAAELYELGLGDARPISALHGLGTGDLLDELLDLLAPQAPGDAPAGGAAPDGEPAAVAVVIVGRPNAGKSSLFNAIVGEPRTIVSEIPGTTRDAIDTMATTPHGEFRFIDTAGMRKAAKVSGIEYYAYLRSLQSLDRAHVAIVVADATLGMNELDVSICSEAMRRGCATVVALNKSDLTPPDLDEARALATRKLRQKPPVLAISARTGAGVAQLLDVVATLDTRYTAHIVTAELNRALAEVAAARPAPQRRGKRLKMYYAAQYGTAPPRFAIEINDRSLVTREFGFYVENRLRSHFGLEGVPVIIDFKGK
jgi:GTP-binding protein